MNYVAHQLLGRALLGLGHYVEAEIRLYEKISMAPQSDLARFFLVALFELTDRVEEAHAMWCDLKNINPDFSLEHYQQVTLNKVSQWYPKLIEGLQKAGLPD